MTVDRNDNLNRAKRIARQQLQSFMMSGIRFLPKANGKHEFQFALETGPEPQAAPSSGAAPKAASQIVRSSSDTARETKSSFFSSSDSLTDRYESELLPLAERTEKLSAIESRVTQCSQCSELAACRTKTVFGVGNPQPELCFLGEGPGADEDRQGEPFVGQAGQLLNKIISACKMSREEVYILNTVKCRPPGNRNPNEAELENCWPYAVEQLEILQPKFICCLGSVAAKTLLKTTRSIGKMRGQFFRFRGSQVVVTYHPAYLLRNPAAKRQVWDDMKMLLAAMGRQL